MSSIQPAQHKSPLVPSLFKTIRSGYSLGMLSKDVSAGITVGVVALPLALAFAIASGLTPERGLYTSIIAGFFMAFFSGSRFPVSGPTGAFVVIIYSIVSRHGYEGLVLTTLMAGILLVIFGFLRLGALVKYIPYPVTTGFTTGIALLIFSSQMKDFFGLPLVDTPPEFFDKWGAYAQNAMDFSPATFGVAVFTLLVILIVRHKIPKVPAPVVAVFLSTLLVWLFSLPTDTIGSRFGTLPTGFPDFTLPYGITFERIRELFPDALTIALLAGIESLLACVVADSMTGDRHNSNMELISQGIGNVASVFFGGFAATGAIARTATNVRAGAHSSVSAIVHSLFLVVVVMWLLPLTEYIPLAALAAVLVMVAYDMSDLRTVRHIFQGPKSDWSVMILTFALTVIFDLTVAVYTGVMLASLLFMRRMSELTGMEAQTVHRLLGMTWNEASHQVTFQKTEKEPLEAEAVIVDEMSMVDVSLFSALLRALRPGTRLVLVGDADQLPSVGAGNVFSDLIRSKKIETVFLREVFRQAEQSAIIRNAHRVNLGESPDLKGNQGDFFFLCRRDAQRAVATVLELCKTRLPDNMHIPAEQIQVLTPTRKGPCGTINLNRLLQEALNPRTPGKREILWGERVFRVGDRIMQTRNDYDVVWQKDDGTVGTGMFNGDVGRIAEIDAGGEWLALDFDGRKAPYSVEMLSEIDLAYAQTVHKAQGSEYRCVVLAAMPSAPSLMVRGVLYTALTRARELLVIVGDDAAIRSMAANDRQQKRYSGLKWRLCHAGDASE